ncbi:MAG: hypothetical protein LKI80_16685 [Sporolactobacillus sp.]|jgi:hypothetical protein|nr:hypothetical protein [Sporolactobacillus sp.]
MENLTDKQVEALNFRFRDSWQQVAETPMGDILRDLQSRKAAYVADPAADAPTKAEFVALRDALVAAGLMEAN